MEQRRSGKQGEVLSPVAGSAHLHFYFARLGMLALGEFNFESPILRSRLNSGFVTAWASRLLRVD
jgi:hypothetical protein